MDKTGNTRASSASAKNLTEPKWAEVVAAKRRELDESQIVFGDRFGVSGATVSNWEKGIYDLPGEVTWWLTHEGAPSVGE